MDSNQLEGNWKVLKGKAQEMWGALSDDDLDRIDGRADQLVGMVQRRYGHSLEEAKREVENWRRVFEC